MIPKAYITEWRNQAPWSQDAWVEQDLVISRALVDIFTVADVANRWFSGEAHVTTFAIFELGLSYCAARKSDFVQFSVHCKMDASFLQWYEK